MEHPKAPHGGMFNNASALMALKAAKQMRLGAVRRIKKSVKETGIVLSGTVKKKATHKAQVIQCLNLCQNTLT